MSKKQKVSAKPSPMPQTGIKRETVILVTLGSFVIGILVGVALTISQVKERPVSSAPPAVGGEPRASGPTPEQMALEQQLQARTQKDPQDVNAWIELGNLHFDLERHAEAIVAYERALAIQPGNPDVITDLGVMYRREGQPEKAVELFREANRADPKHHQSLYNLGVVLLHDLNKIQEAAQAWEEYLRVRPEGPQAEHIRSILKQLRETGKLTQAADGS